METVCKINACTGCTACVEICPKKAIVIQDSLTAYNAVIHQNKCIDCGACHRICQVNSLPELALPILWYQGWSNDPISREKSSSGGVAFEIERAFLDTGHVWSCRFSDGAFTFHEALTVQDVESFRGSKYVKSDPSGVFRTIKEQLRNDKVLFVGLPCQVAALRKFVGNELAGNLFTVDLICHGTPSPQLLDQALRKYQSSLKSIGQLAFRSKNSFRLVQGRKALAQDGVPDVYTTAFMCGLSYTENCYNCQYARTERVSDLTLGDAWGTDLSSEETKKGISLILAMTDKGKRLIENSNIRILPVDLDAAKQNNGQLNHPTKRPSQRDAFFRGVTKGVSFETALRQSLPRVWFKQRMKAMLIALKLLPKEKN